jgi:hypothetical protein
MEKEEVKYSLKSLFDRGIIALSYSAADRIISVISNDDQSIKTAFVILILSLTALLNLSNCKLLQNSGIQTSLSIVVSKLVISMFPLPEEQTVFCLIPAILFYLVLCSCICIIIDRLVKQCDTINLLWNSIVPFVVLFTSAITIQIFMDNAQMGQLYLISICYLALCQYFLYTGKSSENYFLLFFDSLFCRSLVLCIQDYVKANIDDMDFALVAFNACIIIVGYSLRATLSQQITYCISVMTFTISRQILTILQKKCDTQMMPPFVIAIMAMIVFLYNRNLGIPISNISINCISLAWSSIIELWLFSFYGNLEQFLIYIIVFIALQSFEDFALSIYDFSEGLISPNLFYNHDLMVIAHDGSSLVGLPST